MRKLKYELDRQSLETIYLTFDRFWNMQMWYGTIARIMKQKN